MARSPKPVFVDRTGRRRRVIRVAGASGALALVLASLLLVAGFTGAGAGDPPRLPEPAGGRLGGAPTRPAADPATPAQRPAAPATASPTPLPATTAVATATPTPSRSNHRRVPTHTPGNKPSKPG
jgi:hypothetical protein